MAVRITLQRALLGTIAAAVLVGIVPAGFALDRTLVSALLTKARSDLEMAPGILADRASSRSEMLRMHAHDFAQTRGLAEAIARGDRQAIQQLADQNRALLGGAEPFVVDDNGHSILGPPADALWIDETRRGRSPVAVGVQRSGRSIVNVALAPVDANGKWAGAAGLVEPMDDRTADALARLTRSDITVLVGADDSIAVTLSIQPKRTPFVVECRRCETLGKHTRFSSAVTRSLPLQRRLEARRESSSRERAMQSSRWYRSCIALPSPARSSPSRSPCCSARGCRPA